MKYNIINYKFTSMVQCVRLAIKADVKFCCEKSNFSVQNMFLPQQQSKICFNQKVTKFRGGKDLVDNLTQYHHLTKWETKVFKDSESHLLQSMVYMLIQQVTVLIFTRFQISDLTDFCTFAYLFELSNFQSILKHIWKNISTITLSSKRDFAENVH